MVYKLSLKKSRSRKQRTRKSPRHRSKSDKHWRKVWRKQEIPPTEEEEDEKNNVLNIDQQPIKSRTKKKRTTSTYIQSKKQRDNMRTGQHKSVSIENSDVDLVDVKFDAHTLYGTNTVLSQTENTNIIRTNICNEEENRGWYPVRNHYDLMIYLPGSELRYGYECELGFIMTDCIVNSIDTNRGLLYCVEKGSNPYDLMWVVAMFLDPSTNTYGFRFWTRFISLFGL